MVSKWLISAGPLPAALGLPKEQGAGPTIWAVNRPKVGEFSVTSGLSG